jgi:RimJ/RimL family protein N-acetyltransferase
MNANTNDFRFFLEGKRIYLREVRESDVNEQYYRWINDPDMTQFL